MSDFNIKLMSNHNIHQEAFKDICLIGEETFNTLLYRSVIDVTDVERIMLIACLRFGNNLPKARCVIAMGAATALSRYVYELRNRLDKDDESPYDTALRGLINSIDNKEITLIEAHLRAHIGVK